MIKLTLIMYDGEEIYLNPDHIVNVQKDHNGGTHIQTIVDCTTVRESPEEVARKVLEWRLAMERYRVALSLENPNLWEAEEKKLKALAGLEESNHDECWRSVGPHPARIRRRTSRT